MKDGWDKVDVVGKLLGAVLIPLALAATGFFVNFVLQNRASQDKKFEIAVTVLQSPNASASPVRDWTLDTVKKINPAERDKATKN